MMEVKIDRLFIIYIFFCFCGINITQEAREISFAQKVVVDNGNDRIQAMPSGQNQWVKMP